MLSYEHFGISFTGCVKPYSLIISLSYMPFCFVLFFYILTTLGITFELYYLMSSLCYVVRIWTVITNKWRLINPSTKDYTLSLEN